MVVIGAGVIGVELVSSSRGQKVVYVSMDYNKAAVTALLMHWSYLSLALSHR